MYSFVRQKAQLLHIRGAQIAIFLKRIVVEFFFYFHGFNVMHCNVQSVVAGNNIEVDKSNLVTDYKYKLSLKILDLEFFEAAIPRGRNLCGISSQETN